MCVHEVEARQHARTHARTHARARAHTHTHTHPHTHTCFTPALAGTRASLRTRRAPGVAAAEAHCAWPPPIPCWRAATLQAAMSQCPCFPVFPGIPTHEPNFFFVRNSTTCSNNTRTKKINTHILGVRRGNPDREPTHFDDLGYASATCPRSEVRATVQAP
jgi:hypothetical protein